MCGIAGVHRLKGAPVDSLGQLANELLLAIENRGQHSTGLLALGDDHQFHLTRRMGPARAFVRSRKAFPASARTLLLHTRYATVGERTVLNAHPIISGDIAAIHNGTIYNADRVFRAFGLPRHAEVDSEVIPALVSFAGWDKAASTLTLLEGGAAVTLVNRALPREVFLARLDSFPLVYAKQGNVLLWASTREALKGAWKAAHGGELTATCYALQEGEYVYAQDGKLINGWLDGMKPRPKEVFRGTTYADYVPSNGMSPATRAFLALEEDDEDEKALRELITCLRCDTVIREDEECWCEELG